MARIPPLRIDPSFLEAVAAMSDTSSAAVIRLCVNHARTGSYPGQAVARRIACVSVEEWEEVLQEISPLLDHDELAAGRLCIPMIANEISRREKVKQNRSSAATAVYAIKAAEQMIQGRTGPLTAGKRSKAEVAAKAARQTASLDYGRDENWLATGGYDIGSAEPDFAHMRSDYAQVHKTPDAHLRINFAHMRSDSEDAVCTNVHNDDASVQNHETRKVREFAETAENRGFSPVDSDENHRLAHPGAGVARNTSLLSSEESERSLDQSREPVSVSLSVDVSRGNEGRGFSSETRPPASSQTGASRPLHGIQGHQRGLEWDNPSPSSQGPTASHDARSPATGQPDRGLTSHPITRASDGLPAAKFLEEENDGGADDVEISKSDAHVAMVAEFISRISRIAPIAPREAAASIERWLTEYGEVEIQNAIDAVHGRQIDKPLSYLDATMRARAKKDLATMPPTIAAQMQQAGVDPRKPTSFPRPVTSWIKPTLHARWTEIGWAARGVEGAGDDLSTRKFAWRTDNGQVKFKPAGENEIIPSYEQDPGIYIRME